MKIQYIGIVLIIGLYMFTNSADHSLIYTLSKVLNELSKSYNFNEDGNTALHKAVIVSDLLQVQKILLSQSVNPATRNAKGQTPLNIINDIIGNRENNFSDFNRTNIAIKLLLESENKILKNKKLNFINYFRPLMRGWIKNFLFSRLVNFVQKKELSPFIKEFLSQNYSIDF